MLAVWADFRNFVFATLPPGCVANQLYYRYMEKVNITAEHRSAVMSVAKGIAIIAMVVGHAEAPGVVTDFIYTWHMPLFFIAAGFFFSEKWVADPWGFISRRFEKLYIPFVKWSLLFLLLHNVWFHFGILNEQYGNWTGGVTRPYTLRTAMYRLASIVTSMSGYDEFMAGAFWFFRGLLVASVLFLVAYRLLRLRTALSPVKVCLLVCAACVALVAFRLQFGVKLTYYPNGGWREMWGVFFFSAGVLMRQLEHRLPVSFWVIIGGVALLVAAALAHLRGMNNGAMWRDLWSLPLTGTVGFIAVRALSHHIALGRLGAATLRALHYVGSNTMPIFVFHIISYKVVSLLKIWWYGLDFGQIGCHMVIHYRHTDGFWVLYSLVGVLLPLSGVEVAAWVRRRVALWRAVPEKVL